MTIMTIEKQCITIATISISTPCINFARDDNTTIVIVDGIVAAACDNTAIINIKVASTNITAIIIVDGITISINVACNNNITIANCIDVARNSNTAIIIVDGIVAVAHNSDAIININVVCNNNTDTTISIDVAHNSNTDIIIVDSTAVVASDDDVSINVACNDNNADATISIDISCNGNTAIVITRVNDAGNDDSTVDARDNSTVISFIVDTRIAFDVVNVTCIGVRKDANNDNNSEKDLVVNSIIIDSTHTDSVGVSIVYVTRVSFLPMYT